MKIIGLTGGIGSGKSTVADLLRKRGWIVYSSDEIAKELLHGSKTVQNEVAALLGTTVIVDNAPDNDAISALVFGDTPAHKKRLADLNKIIHPRVLEQHIKNIEKHRALDSPLIAIETALLFEVGLQEGFDYVIVVDAPREACIARAMERSNSTASQVEARMGEQMSFEEKRGMADFVITNDKDLASLATAVDMVAQIVEVLPASSPDDDDEFGSEFEDGYDEDDIESDDEFASGFDEGED